MTRTLRRLATSTVAASLAAVLLSGCGTGPLRSGAAATVGSGRISTAALAGMVSRGLQDPQAQQQLGADRPKFQRDTLSRLIRHRVLAEAARRVHVTATAGEVDARIAQFEQQAGGPAQLYQQAAQGGIAAPDLRPFITDLVLSDAIGDALTRDIPVPPAQIAALYSQNLAQYDQVHAAHILLPTKARADAILKQVTADPSRFAALAAQYSTDTSNKDKGGDLGFAGRGAFVKAFDTAVFAAKPGQIFEVHTQFGFHVVRVLERRTTTLAQATPALRRSALQRQRDALVGALLSRVARDLHVQVNPRFGRWDASQLAVVDAAGKDSVSSPAPSPADTTGAGALQNGNGAPQNGAPQNGPPQNGAPQNGAPQNGAPQNGAPQNGAPQNGAPPASP